MNRNDMQERAAITLIGQVRFVLRGSVHTDFRTTTLMVLREIIETRSTRRRWVCILCGIIVASVAVLSAGMEGTSIAGLLFLPLVLICIVQYLRPTLLLWAVLALAFLAYSLAIVTHVKGLTIIGATLFSSVGLIPWVSLLWAWPRVVQRT